MVLLQSKQLVARSYLKIEKGNSQITLYLFAHTIRIEIDQHKYAPNLGFQDILEFPVVESFLMLRD